METTDEAKVSPQEPARQSTFARFLSWAFGPPRWAVECQSAIDEFQEDTRLAIARMEEDLEAMRRPPIVYGKDAWMK